MRLISESIRRQGQRLLDQQCWNWGRDIVGTEGNLLLKAGFTKQRPPPGRTGSTRYSIELSDGGCLVLWGFGVFFGTAEKGGVYLGRFQFEPRWLPVAAIDRPIWRPDLVPAGQTPPAPAVTVELTAAVAMRIAGYEEWTLARYGLEYRCRVLRAWKEAEESLAPQLLPGAWRGLADQLAAAESRNEQGSPTHPRKCPVQRRS